MEKEIHLLLGQSYIFMVMLSYDTFSDKNNNNNNNKKKKKNTIEHTSLFVFDLAIRHTLFVSA